MAPSGKSTASVTASIDVINNEDFLYTIDIAESDTDRDANTRIKGLLLTYTMSNPLP